MGTLPYMSPEQVGSDRWAVPRCWSIAFSAVTVSSELGLEWASSPRRAVVDSRDGLARGGGRLAGGALVASGRVIARPLEREVGVQEAQGTMANEA